MSFDIIAGSSTDRSALKLMMMNPYDQSKFTYDNSLVVEKDASLSNGQIAVYIVIPIIFTILTALAAFLGYLWCKNRRLAKLVQ